MLGPIKRRIKTVLKATGLRNTRFKYHPGRLDSKHFDSAKLIDRRMRYEQATGRRLVWKGKRVLELGGGPVLGWAILAILEGATRYYFLEPAFNPDVLGTERFQKYFKEHLLHIRISTGIQSPYQCLEDLISDDRIVILKRDAQDTGLPIASVDTIVSNSFFEHAQDVDAVAGETWRILSEGGSQFHMIDFQNHRGSLDPFEQMYDIPRDEFLAMQSLLNGLRPEEFLACYSAFHPSLIEFLPYIRWDEDFASLRNRHVSWNGIDSSILAVASWTLSATGGMQRNTLKPCG